MVLYEYPFNERVRILLRLEDLHHKLEYFLLRTEIYDHQVVLELIFEIADVLSRSDLKSELLQELTRQKNNLKTSLANSPHTPGNSRHELEKRIDVVREAFSSLPGKTGAHLQSIEWLASIRHRLTIPGGTSEFDLPSYHAWQHKQHKSRLSDIAQWIAPFIPFFDAMKLVLEILRSNSKSHDIVAPQGTYEKLLRDQINYQMLQITLDGPEIVPEISANKYMLRVRFTTQDEQFKILPCRSEVPFKLTLCAF